MINGIDYYRSMEPFFKCWKIERYIGEGSSGEVFEISCTDAEGRNRRAALKAICIPKSDTEFKILRNDGFTPESAVSYIDDVARNIEKEYSFMARFNGHPNIVGYEDHTAIRHANGIGWDILIRMELLTPLPDYAAERGFTDDDVIKLGIHMCTALELCHEHNVIHRDIKPENIFVDGAGNFKLGDFGIAREIERTQSGLTKIGTLAYMAPEIYKGQSYGRSVDIYSLGIVLYKLLNHNRLPFMPRYPKEIIFEDKERALNERMDGTALPFPDGTWNKDLCDIILKACSPDSKDRFQSAAEMRLALENLGSPENDIAAVPTAPVSHRNNDRNIATPTGKNQAPKRKRLARILIPVLLLILLVQIVILCVRKCSKDSNDSVDSSNCKHTNITQNYGEKNYTSALAWSMNVEYVCNNCGKTTATKTELGRDECPHPEENIQLLSSEPEYDDEYNVKWHIYHTKKCLLCNEQVGETEVEHGKNECSHPETAIFIRETGNDTDTKPVWDKKCKVCNEVVESDITPDADECTHENVKATTGTKKYSNDVNWSQLITYTCADCGEVVKTETKTGRDDCKHAKTTKSYGKKNYSSKLKWTRTVTEDCTVCGANIKSYTESGTDTCTHSDTRSIERGEKKYAANNLDWTRVINTRCDVCKEIINTTTESGKDDCKHAKTTKSYGQKNYSSKLKWTRTVTENCAVCGKENIKSYTESGTDTCTHSDTRSTERGEKKYAENGLDWTQVVNTICDVCKEIISTTTDSGRDNAPEKQETASFDYIFDFYEGRAVVMKDAHYGVIDSNHNIVIPTEYNYIWPYTEGYTVIMKNNKYGYADKSGNIIVPPQYINADSFNEGMARVLMNGKWGFVNTNGTEIVAAIYDAADRFSGGRAKVTLNGETFYIDKNGNRVE